MDKKEEDMIMEGFSELKNELKSLKKQEEVLVYDTKGLAKALNMSLNYAGKLMHTRGFPSMKIGGSYKVSKTALEDWLRHNEGHEVELDR